MIRTSYKRVNYLSRLLVSNSKCYSTETLPKRDADWDKAIPYNKIPGPTKFELIRSFLPGEKKNIGIEELSRTLLAQYGEVVRIPGLFGRKDVIFTYNPEISEKVYRTEGLYPYRPGLEAFIHYRQKVRPDVFGGLSGLASANGQEWYDARKKTNPFLLQPKVVRMYVEKVDQVACDFIDKIRQMRNKETNEMPNTFGHELNKWALESIGVIALDERLGTLSDDSPDGQKIIESVRKFFVLSYDLEFGLPIWKYFETANFKELMQVFDVMTETVMKFVDKAVVCLDAKEKSGDESDKSVLEKLLEVDRKFAVIMAFDMILASVDTTSATLAGCLYHLSQNPDKQAKLREEVLKFLPEKSSKLTPEVLNQMPYMKACVKESLRIHPVVAAHSRRTSQDVVLGGYQVPKGVDVVMASIILQNDPQHFTDADKFVPERWLRENANKLPNPFIHLPFGFGPRSCIGRRFAELELEVILARMIRNFNVQYHYGPLKYAPKSLVLAPDPDLKFRLTDLNI